MKKRTMGPQLQPTQGQSLIELIIAIAIAAILIVGGVAIISPILRTSTDVARIQAASALGRQLLENVRVLSESNWHALDGLTTGSSGRYYVVATGSPFFVATGTESITLSTTTYSRYFYIDTTLRNSASPYEINTAGTASDPSTRKLTVVYQWPSNSGTASNTIVSYLTRARDTAFTVTDWSGGGTQDGPLTATGTNSHFATSSNIDYTGTPGSIVISGY